MRILHADGALEDLETRLALEATPASRSKSGLPRHILTVHIIVQPFRRAHGRQVVVISQKIFLPTRRSVRRMRTAGHTLSDLHWKPYGLYLVHLVSYYGRTMSTGTPPADIVVDAHSQPARPAKTHALRVRGTPSTRIAQRFVYILPGGRAKLFAPRDACDDALCFSPELLTGLAVTMTSAFSPDSAAFPIATLKAPQWSAFILTPHSNPMFGRLATQLLALTAYQHKRRTHNTPATMNPFMQDSIMSSTGMPTLGRRAKGFETGASPFGPGGAVPVHQMNFLMGGMGRHGMYNTPFGAGAYPHPRAPFPLGYTAAPMMPMSMGPYMMGDGGMDSFMPSPFGSSMRGAGMNSYPPFPMSGMGGFGGAPTLLDELDDSDDSGVWDGDDDVETFSGPFDIFYRANRRAKRRHKGESHPLDYCTPTTPLLSVFSSLPSGCFLNFHCGLGWRRRDDSWRPTLRHVRHVHHDATNDGNARNGDGNARNGNGYGYGHASYRMHVSTLMGIPGALISLYIFLLKQHRRSSSSLSSAYEHDCRQTIASLGSGQKYWHLRARFVNV
ncbi:uncharacterized protein MYCFIDRAFT_171683 [Pseudocercospora fijiensis CIRAD86]|uniref:Uncharacterized protein n=1 Tax=Pseudocercospora fijiensis (strain CIRAD86) TaxID=383855 RepID=M3A3Z0_PSEFD|nr:uncharacterized protein MYCFIDRAFT_171683 [Pseudocercospora fijiensis CIRAD86]EME85814.1 hypothetical protein MYCFIDRAFT_171683 [Pseudocercospora fijiensis CIRAD86]